MLADLRELLVADEWRKEVGFSPDIDKANATLLRRESIHEERQEVMENWLQGHKNQPCFFGKAAGFFSSMHFCFLTEDDLSCSDDHLREKIDISRKVWKRRALIGVPTHGFMLVVCDEAVLDARPDPALRDFAMHLQGLAGWEGRIDQRGNDISDEWLYLTNPKTKDVMKFTFSVDFFAAAADGRWWKDHRVPGGMAFTANSLGHMYWQNRWYEEEDKNKKPYTMGWALRNAMKTIGDAAKHGDYCPATYLLNEGPSGPRQPCRWAEDEPLPQNKMIAGKDHTSYDGYLHTDHAVRVEFFDGSERPAHYDAPYEMNFTYIFDEASPDNLPFMRGEVVSREGVEAELGLPELVRPISMTTDDAEVYANARPTSVAEEIERAVVSTREWRLTAAELDDLMS